MELYTPRYAATFNDVPRGAIFLMSVHGTYRVCLRTFFERGINGEIESLAVLGPPLEGAPPQPMIFEPEELNDQAMVIGQDARILVSSDPIAQRPTDEIGNDSGGTVVLVGGDAFLKTIHSTVVDAKAIYVNIATGEIVTTRPPGPYRVVDQWRIVESHRHADVDLWKFPADE